MAAHAREDATPEIKRQLDQLIERFEHRRALAMLDDPQAGGQLPKPLAQLARGRALAGLEQFHDAYNLFSEVRRERDVSQLVRIEAQWLSARVLRHHSPLVDFALELANAAAEAGTRAGLRGKALAVCAHVEAAQLYGRKRCPELSRAEIAKARALELDPARAHAGEAEVALQFDERAQARRSFEAALGCDDPLGKRLGHLGLARVLTLVGEFSAAEHHLQQLDPVAPLDLPYLRVKSDLLSSQAKWEELAAVLDAIATAAPDGDPAPRTRYERAAALYRAGYPERAREVWQALATPENYFGRLSQRMLDKTARADSLARRLAAFPSVSQLRNHCGPASVELCLRFFGTAANQVDVAREIKHPDGGTPVHKMRWYMDRAGFSTRRVEADLPKLKAILAAGVPVILEEDYSMSRHVAVAVGFDDRRELLEVQDPMTHEIRETFYEDLPRLREFSNHGALVAIPAGREDLARALDEVGAVECAYMTKTDLAWQAHDEKRYDEGDRLIAEALALHEAYELAWVYRFVRARQTLRNANGDDERKAGLESMSQVVDRIVELWPNDEWPQQYLGELFEFKDEPAEALAAFERARDRDPQDANNYCAVGDALLSLGRRDDARKAFEQALERDPSHVRANENLSDLAQENGDASLATILNACALELQPGNPFNHGVRGRILAARGDHAGAAAAFGAAVERVSNRPYYIIEHARELALSGSIDEALERFQKLADERRNDAHCLVQWADTAYVVGRTSAARDVCSRLEALDPSHPAAPAIGGAARCKEGDLEAGLSAFRRALHMAPTYGWVYKEMGRYLAQAGRHDEALTAFAANAGVNSGASATCLLAAELADAGYADRAINFYKRVIGSGQMSESDFLKLARAMRSTSGPNAVHRYFGQLAQEHPRVAALLTAHVRFLVEDMWAPGATSTALSKLAELNPDSPFVLAREGDDLMDASLETEPRGEELLRQALAADPSLVYPRRLLIRQLNQRGRFDEALALGAEAKLDAETAEDRVESLLGLGREADAERAATEYAATLPEDEGRSAAAQLRFRIAQVAGRFEDALAQAELVSKAEGEVEDDGQLSPWERKRFRCLVALRRADVAYAFGEAQCADAEDRGDLAYEAWNEDDLALAERFAKEALALDPNEVSALHITAKLAEHAGDVPGAIAIWERMMGVTGWHIHVENIARLSLATGNLERAQEFSERAISTGHHCPVALQVRAETRLLSGDREGARADAERAAACVQLEHRRRSKDTFALLAALQGNATEARRLFDEHVRDAPLSPAGRSLVSKVMEALGV